MPEGVAAKGFFAPTRYHSKRRSGLATPRGEGVREDRRAGDEARLGVRVAPHPRASVRVPVDVRGGGGGVVGAAALVYAADGVREGDADERGPLLLGEVHAGESCAPNL